MATRTPTDSPGLLVLQAARRHVWLAGAGGAERHRVRGGVDLVPGDRAFLDPEGVVSRRAERRNELARQTVRARQVLAANVDVLGVVTAAGPRVSGDAMIARVLAAALAQRIEPLVVFNKADADGTGELEGRAARYRDQGFEALVVSARTGRGMEALEARCAGREVVLVGASGVGKSTLINALHPEADQRVGEVDVRGYGRHTTTLARAIPWPRGLLIDLPGVRSFGLVDPAGLDHAFPQIAREAEGCRFGDCRHRTEPECAVREAVAAGRLDPERVALYLDIKESVARGTEGLRK